MTQVVRKWWVLVAAGLAGLLVAVDFTIVNTCLPHIQRDFHATDHSLQWIITGFGISFCALMTPCGRMADLVGRRKTFYIATIGFLLASLGAGMSRSINMLIVMRFLQGAMGAPIFPTAIAIAIDIFPEEQHARALGILGSLTGIGLGVGPILGGMIASISSWRWIFFINIPVLVFSLALSFYTMPESRSEGDQAIDWWGSGLLILILAGALVYINEGGIFGWLNPYLLGYLAAAFIGLIAFIFVEKKVREPLVNYRYFNNRYFMIGLTQYCSTISICWAVAFLIPLYLSKVLGYNIAKIGWTMAIMTILTIVSPTVTGYLIDKFNNKLIIQTSFLLSVLGLILLAMMGTDPSFLYIAVAFVVFGWAWGTGNILPANIALRENIESAALYSGVLYTIGNTLGVILLTISSTVLWHINRVSLLSNMKHSQLHLTANQLSQTAMLANTPAKMQQFLERIIGTSQHTMVTKLIHASLASGFEISFIVLMVVSLIASAIAIYCMSGSKAPSL